MSQSSFDKSLASLEKLLEEIQDPNAGIDKLAAKIAKAKELVTSCKSKLRGIEESVNDIFDN